MLEQLKDIKSVETIQVDFIPYLLVATVLILLFATVIFFLMRKKKKITKKQLAINGLKSMKFETLSDKQIAYRFTELGYMCVEEYYLDEFLKIVKQLEPFKYKKEVGKIDEDLINQMKDYIKVRL